MPYLGKNCFDFYTGWYCINFFIFTQNDCELLNGDLVQNIQFDRYFTIFTISKQSLNESLDFYNRS